MPINGIVALRCASLSGDALALGSRGASWGPKGPNVRLGARAPG